MAILKIKYFLFLPVVLLTGCYTDFDPELKSEPVLCLNALIEPGQTITYEVSRSWLYNDVQSAIDHSVNDASVHIFVNGAEVEKDFRPSPGDRVKLIAFSKTVGQTQAETAVPPKASISIKSVDVNVSRIGLNYWIDFPDYSSAGNDDMRTITEIDFTFSLLIDVEVKDPAKGLNYFRCIAKESYDGELSEDSENTPDEIVANIGNMNYEIEPIFSEHLDPIDALNGSVWGFNFFSDRKFEDASYTLHLGFSDSYIRVRYSSPCEEGSYPDIIEPDMKELKAELSNYLDMNINVILETISESYYNWANYSWQMDSGMLGDLSSIGLTDPIGAYSNTSAGAGIVAARTPTVEVISLKPYLVKALEKD